jgi:hypothetical protein
MAVYETSCYIFIVLVMEQYQIKNRNRSCKQEKRIYQIDNKNVNNNSTVMVHYLVTVVHKKEHHYVIWKNLRTF